VTWRESGTTEFCAMHGMGHECHMCCKTPCVQSHDAQIIQRSRPPHSHATTTPQSHDRNTKHPTCTEFAPPNLQRYSSKQLTAMSPESCFCIYVQTSTSNATGTHQHLLAKHHDTAKQASPAVRVRLPAGNWIGKT
jgi:hypothetical protein